MDLSTSGIYSSALSGLTRFPQVYLLLFVWTLIVSIIVAVVAAFGSSIFLGTVMATALSNGSPKTVYYLSVSYIGILLLVTSVLFAATKAGFMSFGSAIRKNLPPTPFHFFNGIIKYTLPLFIGGLIVGMLTSIPFLAFLSLARISLSGVISDVFTSGWNYSQAVSIMSYLLGLGQLAMLCNVIIFFWLTPWDEMVVLFDIPYPEALVRSFTFVFSRQHFLRVLLLIIANVVLSQIVLLATNMGDFLAQTHSGLGIAWLNVLFGSSQNIFTTIIQFVLYPFFIYTQIFLLPWPVMSIADELPERSELISITYPPAD